MHQSVKVILEYLPLVLFYICFKAIDLATAIAVLVGASCISTLLIKLIWKKVSKLLCLSTVIIALVGIAYAITGDTRIFKMKPTIIFTIMAFIISANMALKGRIYDARLGELLGISKKSVNVLSWLWLGYFISAAVLNEIVWRNFSDETWVNFKVFGFTGLNIIFICISLMYVNFISKKGHATK